MAALCFLFMWPVARLRFAGLSEEERSRPVQGWRRWLLHPLMLGLSRLAFFFLGFLWVRVKGRRAELKEAPVLVVAPHSSFMDMVSLMPTQLATVVSRSENTSLPVVGGEGGGRCLPRGKQTKTTGQLLVKGANALSPCYGNQASAVFKGRTSFFEVEDRRAGGGDIDCSKWTLTHTLLCYSTHV